MSLFQHFGNAGAKGNGKKAVTDNRLCSARCGKSEIPTCPRISRHAAPKAARNRKKTCEGKEKKTELHRTLCITTEQTKQLPQTKRKQFFFFFAIPRKKNTKKPRPAC